MVIEKAPEDRTPESRLEHVIDTNLNENTGANDTSRQVKITFYLPLIIKSPLHSLIVSQPCLMFLEIYQFELLQEYWPRVIIIIPRLP